MSRIGALLVPALAGLVTFAGSLAYSFSQDDFTGLARAAGLMERLDGPWRWLSLQGFYDVMRGAFGLEPRPYHLVSLYAHAACSILVGAFLMRWTSPPAALVGAAFYATHAALYTSVYWIAAIGDSMALGFALAALLVAQRHDRVRYHAVPLFALSLASKESTLLLPLAQVALAAGTLPRGTPLRERLSWSLRDPLHLLLAGCALAFAAVLAWEARSTGSAEDPVTGPYAISLGLDLGRNLLTYLGWSANFLLPTVNGFSDAIDPSVFGWGAGLLALWIAGLASRELRRRGWLVAGVLFLVFVLPVLGLRNHTYHYYLVAPLVGVAWMVAALADVALARARARGVGRAVPHLAAICAAAALAANGRALVHRIETEPFPRFGLRSDPTVDRALVFERVRAGIDRGTVPAGSTLVLWSPARAVPGADPDAPETYWERNVRAALMDGMALRVFYPQAARVAFVRERPSARDSTLVVVYGLDGRADLFTPAALESILLPAAAPEMTTPRPK